MTNLELNTVSIALQTARKILSEIKPVLDQLNVIYDSDGGDTPPGRREFEYMARQAFIAAEAFIHVREARRAGH